MIVIDYCHLKFLNIFAIEGAIFVKAPKQARQADERANEAQDQMIKR